MAACLAGDVHSCAIAWWYMVWLAAVALLLVVQGVECMLG
jgi:hypothetical protein